MLRVIGELTAVKSETRKVGGRPPEDDDERLAAMAALVQIGFSRWRAAGMVTEDIPDATTRETARKRVNRKFKISGR